MDDQTGSEEYGRRRDVAALSLNDATHLHDAPGCGQLRTLAELLDARAHDKPCPRCGQYSIAGLDPGIGQARASAMLDELRARRAELGLRDG